MARSKVLEEKLTLPWLNSWVTRLSDTPWPTVEDAFCNGDVAKISPKSVRERLKPMVPALAMLLAVTPNCAVAAFKPVSAVKKDMVWFLRNVWKCLQGFNSRRA